MDRRTFLSTATVAAIASGLHPLPSFANPEKAKLKSMALGLLISPHDAPEATIKRVRDMGFSNCFLSLDGYIGKFTSDAAIQIGELLAKYEVIPTTVEVVGPEPLEWNFVQGPSTIGLVPPKTRAARIDALKQVSDFARLLGISQVQTHCGFIPENPADALYFGSVEAIRTVAQHCLSNEQNFLMETGQETPTTMSRVIRDVNMSNLGVGLDTANLILYGKANPVDAVEILGPHVRSVHAKDGKWPTDPSRLGEEVLIGKGLVDFKKVFTKLHEFGYTGAITIERETSGPQQIEDVRNEKLYLQRIVDEVLSSS
jgi:L-ribulose-5-phosphate 3-epimerase